MREDPDAALVLASRAGDRRAFEQLLARYERPVFNAAFRILHHRDDAADVTQTAFLRAYEHLDRYDPAQRFFSWLYRIAINEAMDMGARRKPDALVLEAVADPGEGPDGRAAGAQSDARLERALMALSVDQRALVVLKHVQDFSYEQIAEILDCPVKTVKSRLFSARRALRDRLLAQGWVAA
jgi:RNA polymerase sigma-70 factor (ECF subfamily)